MSFFTFDESQVKSGFELVEEGTYEATITNAEATKTKAGDPMLTLTYEIRSDYTQKHQGAKFMYNNFTFGSDIAKGIVQGLVKSAGFPNGQQFSSLEDMAKQLYGKGLQIVVKHEDDTYNDKPVKRARVKYTKPSSLGAPQTSGPVNVSEKDLPF